MSLSPEHGLSVDRSSREFAALGATFDHVALAAPRIRDLLPLWQDALQGVFVVGADSPDVGWRTVRLAFGGTWVVELIEPLQGSTFFEKFFTRNPSGGVHHVTFLVDDVLHVDDRLRRAGYAPFGADATGYQCFVHPRHANGVLIQFMARRVVTESEEVPMTLNDVLSGRGHQGTGLLSP